MVKLKMIFVDHRFRLHQTQKITEFFFSKNILRLNKRSINSN
jgi:hypothetical protein